uniref:ERC protein 2 n=1 Tax=Angiostrongylus cantonensis TaxID=6313 RepID=A0A0K0D338_ANGCA
MCIHFADKQAEPAKVPKRDPFADSGENVLLVQQLRDQISKLNSVVAQKDVAMLEKDKKIAALQADLMSAERKHREKVDQLLREKDEAIQKVIERHRQASKQENITCGTWSILFTFSKYVQICRKMIGTAQ